LRKGLVDAADSGFEGVVDADDFLTDVEH
jgi:hypothetical protein